MQQKISTHQKKVLTTKETNRPPPRLFAQEFSLPLGAPAVRGRLTGKSRSKRKAGLTPLHLQARGALSYSFFVSSATSHTRSTPSCTQKRISSPA